MIDDIGKARGEGVRLVAACEVAGINLRTYRRWTRGGEVRSDGCPTAAHQLSAAERVEVLRVCGEPRFASLPPSQIVPRLADEGVYGFGVELLSGAARDWSATAPGPRRCAKPQGAHQS